MAITRHRRTKPYRRSRDRHGRGLRSPLMPATLPAARSRRKQFDLIVATATAELRYFAPELRVVDVVVEDVPVVPSHWHRIPLGRVVRQTTQPQLVIHWRPLMYADDQENLVRDVLAELAAELVHCQPSQLDPHYPHLG